MNAIIPLAGPDFVHPRFGIRPLVEVKGEPLVRRAITGRPCWPAQRRRSASIWSTSSMTAR